MFFRVSLTFLLFTSKLTHLVYFYFYLKLYNYHNLKYLCPIQHAHYKKRLVFFVNVSGVIIFLEVSPSVFIMDLMKIILIYLVLVAVVDTAPLARKPFIRARDIVKRVEQQQYLLVDQEPADFSEGSGKRSERSIAGKNTGTQHCPWDFENDRDANRIPQTIAKAVCKNCASHCRKVDFEHKILKISRTDEVRTDGKKVQLNVWKWEIVTLPIAFVYEPLN